MEKITVYTMERGVRRLKEGITLERYQEKFPNAIKIGKVPSMNTLERWFNDSSCKALDGCKVEPDGTCSHGLPSWLIAMNII